MRYTTRRQVIVSILTSKAMRRIIYTICAIMTISLGACLQNKDKTATWNPDHVEAVTGISDEGYTVYLGDRFSCTPEVLFSDSTHADDYEYRWLIGNSETIGDKRTLDWEIELPSGYKLNNAIPGVFVVRNKVNELEFRQPFTLTILTGYTPTYIALYETPEGMIEWISLQGEPREFSRWFDNMIDRVNHTTIPGPFVGAFNSTDELAIFTDSQPDYGYTVSMIDAEEGDDFVANVGEIVGRIYGRVYHGSASQLDISNVVYGVGASKYLISNGTLHVFNGLEKRLPMYNEATYVKSRDVVQAISSKQFMRFKKATFVRHTDNRIGCFHVYNDQMEWVQDGESVLQLDTLCGAFTQSTGEGSNKPYDIYLVAGVAGGYEMIRFHVDYIKTTVQPIVLEERFPMPTELVESVRYWFGSFGEEYAFYTTRNAVYRFDYHDMTAFTPATTPLIQFADDVEIVDIYPLQESSTFRDEDDCTVAFLYNAQRQTTTLYVYDTVTGRKLAEYPDLLPGKGLYFTKR